ncbi:MAG: phage tail tube protein [bacterium]
MAFHGKYVANIDYIEEGTYGSTPSNPALVWPGRVYSVRPLNKVKNVVKRYLPPASVTDNKALSLTAFKVGEEIGLDIGMVPQTGSLLAWLIYWLGGTTAAPVSDTQKSVSMVLTDPAAATNKYHTYAGMTGSELTLDAQEDREIDIKCKMLGAELTVGNTDPKGSGSHPSASAGAELTFEDISAAQLKYTASGSYANLTDALHGLTFSIKNKLVLVKDINNTKSTKIQAIVVAARELGLTLDIDYTDIGTGSATNFGITDIRSLTDFSFKFTLDSKTYTFTGVKFPELPYEFGPDDIFGDKLTSLPITSLSIA